MTKILTAMSGGVDSAVTAALLQKDGFSVGGAVMVLHENGEQEAADAERSAARLGLPFHIFRWQEEFYRLVQEPFMREYQRGNTPNPCIFCNRTVKFGLFLDRALELGYDGMATGHYARVERSGSGRYLLKRAKDPLKDQTYMLYSLSQAQLARIRLPMGDMTKAEAREYARELGLEVAEKHDSQDICFVPDGDYMRFLLDHGVVPQPGRFLGLDGKDYGPHRGQECYTIGQRRGLELPCGERVYVVRKENGNVRIGPNEALFSTRVQIGDVNFIPFDRPNGELRAEAKLRYTPRAAACTVRPTEYGAELLFDEPQRAVTPGQAAVLYDGDVVLGGGTILSASGGIEKT